MLTKIKCIDYVLKICGSSNNSVIGLISSVGRAVSFRILTGDQLVSSDLLLTQYFSYSYYSAVGFQTRRSSVQVRHWSFLFLLEGHAT